MDQVIPMHLIIYILLWWCDGYLHRPQIHSLLFPLLKNLFTYLTPRFPNHQFCDHVLSMFLTMHPSHWLQPMSCCINTSGHFSFQAKYTCRCSHSKFCPLGQVPFQHWSSESPRAGLQGWRCKHPDGAYLLNTALSVDQDLVFASFAKQSYELLG